jgi:hypothetical protein
MTPSETMRILVETVAVCPEMALAERQPEMWHEVLGELRYVDCHEAIVALAKRGLRFIAAGDVYEAVRELRIARVRRAEPLPQPDADPGDPEAYRRAYVEIVTAAGDGDYEQARRELSA